MAGDRLHRLLNVAKDRVTKRDWVKRSIRLEPSEWKALDARLSEDNVAYNTFIRKCIEMYLSNHPTILAMVDSIKRERTPPPKEQKVPFDVKEVASIYAAIAGDRPLPDLDEDDESE